MKIYTDSTYVRNGKHALSLAPDPHILTILPYLSPSPPAMTKWISQWRINGWIDSKGMPVKNQDLLRRLDTLLTAAKERKKVTLVGVSPIHHFIQRPLPISSPRTHPSLLPSVAYSWSSGLSWKRRG